MKHFTTFVLSGLFFCLIGTGSTQAQGTLQFNRVVAAVTASGSQTASAPFSVGTVTIPAGKVWKVEMAAMESYSSTVGDYVLTTSSGHFIRFGDIPVFYGSSTGNVLTMPIWLPAGTYDIRICIYGASGQWRASYSAIEFNIVP